MESSPITSQVNRCLSEAVRPIPAGWVAVLPLCTWVLFLICPAFNPLLRAQPTQATNPQSIAATNPQTANAKYLWTNLRGFGIPVSINGDDDRFIEVQLYLSLDRGQTWRMYARQATQKTEFDFQASEDGEYWFALRTLTRNRQLIPEGKLSPGLIVTVDTISPELSFQVKADPAGRVECRWQATDRHLNPATLKIEYRSSDDIDGVWKSVPVDLQGSEFQGSYADQIAWWPETTARELDVRMSIADRAGNLTDQARRLAIATPPWRHRNESTARVINPSNTLSVAEQSGVKFPGADRSGQSAVGRPESTSIADSTLPTDRESNFRDADGVWAPAPPSSATPTDYFSDNESSMRSQMQILRTPEQRLKPVDQRTWESQTERKTPAQNLQSSTTHAPIENDARSSSAFQKADERSAAHQPNAAVNSNRLPNGEPSYQHALPDQIQPPLETRRQTQNQSQQINQVDDQHVISQSSTRGRGNPYPTPDRNQSSNQNSDGVTVFKSGNDLTQSSTTQRNQPQSVLGSRTTQTEFNPDVEFVPSQRFRLNYGIDAIDPSGVARVDLWVTRDDGRSWRSWGSDPDNVSPFPVEVEEDGLYGFRIVVHSRDGLTGRGPAGGDKPDIYIQVDTQAPLAQIVSVPYGRGDEAGRLVINYRVADEFLMLRPINLYYAAAPDGPWFPIDEGARNEGRHVWKPVSTVPDLVYLKLVAIDRAGNRGTHQLNQPIDVSGLVPRGTIHGVTPIR